jgi:hypothetical protein
MVKKTISRGFTILFMQYNNVLRTSGGRSQKKTQSKAKEDNDDTHSVNKNKELMSY